MGLETVIEKIEKLGKLRSDMINEIGSEVYYQKVNTIQKEVNDLKNQRNYEKLIPLYEKQLIFCADSLEDFINKTTEIAYCLARTNQFRETKELTKEIALFGDLYPDKIFQITMLLTLFLEPEGEEFREILIDTIKGWLKDPISSNQIELVIFDYKDYVSDTDPFDKRKLEITQTNFSNNLIDDIFNVMTTDLTEEKYYYNKETNLIQQFAFGYLSNYPFTTEESRLYVKRIMNNDIKDVIIDGLHFQISFLNLGGFLDFIKENFKENNGFNSFIIHFERKMLEKYKGRIDSLNDLSFQKINQNSLLEELEIYCNENTLDIEKANEIIKNAKVSIALNFLKNANTENETYF